MHDLQFSNLPYRIAIISTLFTVIVLTAGSFPSSHGQEDVLQVRSTTTYLSPVGQMTVIGELFNNGEDYLHDLELDVTLRGDTDSNEPLAVKTMKMTGPFGQDGRNRLTLPPEGRVGFSVTFDDRTLSSRMSNYEFSTRYTIAPEKPRTLNITDSHIYEAGSGNGITNWVILGELKNQGENEMWNTYLIISVHDAGDKVVAVRELRGSFTQDSPMKPGESWAYFTNVHLPSDLTARYVQVYAESEQAVVIPEFSISLIVFASAGSIPVLLIILRRTQLTTLPV